MERIIGFIVSFILIIVFLVEFIIPLYKSLKEVIQEINHMHGINWLFMWAIITICVATIFSDKILSKDFYEMIFLAPLLLISITFNVGMFLPICNILSRLFKCIINCTIFVISIYFLKTSIKENDNFQAFCVVQCFIIYYFWIYYESSEHNNFTIDANSIVWIIFFIIMIIAYILRKVGFYA